MGNPKHSAHTHADETGSTVLSGFVIKEEGTQVNPPNGKAATGAGLNKEAMWCPARLLWEVVNSLTLGNFP